jgi:uncharacterized protein (DUF885 family)
MNGTIAHLAVAGAALFFVAVTGVPRASAGDAAESAKLHDIFDREWKSRLAEDPLLATSVGVHDSDGLLPSITDADLARRDGTWTQYAAEVDAIDPAKLDEADRVNLDIFRAQLRERIDDYRFGAHQIPFNADSGFYSSFSRLPEDVPLRTSADYRNYISRLRAWPGYVDQQIAHMRAGLARGMTQPRAVLDGIDRVIGAHVVDAPEKSVFFGPLGAFPSSVAQTDRAALERDGKAAIMDAVVPAYARLRDFMLEEYIPGARATLGASGLPDGTGYYASQIRVYTTLEMTPREIHDLGLSEVARIRQGMDEVIRRVGFEGSFAGFLEFLRTDPRFYAKSADELLMRAAWIAKTMDGKLPSLFGTLPRLPYTVEPVPDDIAPKYTSGRYVNAPIGSTKPGIYWVNTYSLDKRPVYNLEALTLHEAVPGHHLQIALNQELGELPPFRRYSYISAFGEGWGLYSEWLGIEAGLYKDPYSEFGRLTYEMWRACRLVVDTGIHAFGWTREQALDYLASNTALPLLEVRTEIDRYISWPGQALAYKIGELKIRELRRRAEEALGTSFDLRAFHDAVLRNGSVPLGVLEAIINGWIAERAGDRE